MLSDFNYCGNDTEGGPTCNQKNLINLVIIVSKKKTKTIVAFVLGGKFSEMRHKNLLLS